MYIARFEHIATGYPKQCEITLFEYLLFNIFPNKFLNRIQTKFDIILDIDFFFEGVTYVR